MSPFTVLPPMLKSYKVAVVSFSDCLKALVTANHIAKHIVSSNKCGCKRPKNQPGLPPINLCKRTQIATSQTQNVKLVKIVFLGVTFDHLLNMGI